MTTSPRAAIFGLFPVFLLLLVGCESQPPSGLATVPMQIGGKNYTLEVADRNDARTFGLMRRDTLAKDHGMLFVFNSEEPRSFWMKNVRFPLDIIFMDAHGRVVSVKQMKAYDTNGTPSDGPAQYAVELNEGQAAAAGVKPGAVLELPKGISFKD